MDKRMCVVCEADMQIVSKDGRFMPKHFMFELLRHHMSPAMVDLYECSQNGCSRTWLVKEKFRVGLPDMAGVMVIEIKGEDY